MLSLPTLPRQAKQTEVPVTHRSYLRIAPQHRNPQYSLEREALEAMQQKRYLYIDFQSNSSLIELEKQDCSQYESQDEVEQIGESSIGGMSRLQNVCLPSFKMHKFLNEQRNYIEKRRNWNRLLGRQTLRDTLIDFNTVKHQVNPESLEEFLEKKDIEAQWKKIMSRQEMLYQNNKSTSTQPGQPSAPSNEKYAARSRSSLRKEGKSVLSSKWRLKHLQPLNRLLQN